MEKGREKKTKHLEEKVNYVHEDIDISLYKNTHKLINKLIYKLLYIYILISIHTLLQLTPTATQCLKSKT